MPKECNAWIVRGLTYQQRIILGGNELIEHYQPDGRKLETRFWPGSIGVYNYLKDNLPEGCTIEGEELQAKVASPRMPAVVHRMGMDIAGD